MWRLIGLTPDNTTDLDKEVKTIIRLLEGRVVDFVHIRKPKLNAKQTQSYLSLFPKSIREHLTLHDHYDIAAEFGIGGININKRNANEDISLWNGRLSYSCHSLEGVASLKERADYVLLSPVFDSISKHGYQSAFTLGQLQIAKDRGIIDQKVIAMGGVSKDRVEVLKALGFGGAALLGALWKE
ncbi:MAG: thiamine phosphate synthase [Bacteroidales bacterium]|jgi:thiamine monophosphate synthase|nr:thiamine phosphate synthase [Bacteroidales bacterium]